MENKERKKTIFDVMAEERRAELRSVSKGTEEGLVLGIDCQHDFMEGLVQPDAGGDVQENK